MRDSGNHYGVGSRWLHRLALGSTAIARASLEMDVLLNRAESAFEDRHVFIAGLARAGTTVLLRALFEAGGFRSLTYRNMPFVLMPTLWRRLSRPFHASGISRERAHGDGVPVSFDSAEAFEEVFWRVFCGKDYILPDCLETHAADDETIGEYRQFIAQVLGAESDERPRYLSKNNNNLLRLEVIRRAFPNALILIPFRDPLRQSASLRAQHLNFTERQRTDRFVRQYMDWLGHHEFGSGHKPFRFPSDPPPTHTDPHEIDYWLHHWTAAYRWALKHRKLGLDFVCYERLCEHPRSVLNAALERADRPPYGGDTGIAGRAPADSVHGDCDPGLLDQAGAVYRVLLESSL